MVNKNQLISFAEYVLTQMANENVKPIKDYINDWEQSYYNPQPNEKGHVPFKFKQNDFYAMPDTHYFVFEDDENNNIRLDMTQQAIDDYEYKGVITFNY